MRLGHMTKAEQSKGTRLTYEDEVTPPDMPVVVQRDDAGIEIGRSPAWHPIAVRMWQGALASPMRRYWLDTDWAMILSACDALSAWHSQDPADRAAATLAAVYAELKAFGFDLSSRRRMDVYVERANTSPASAGAAGERAGAANIRNIRGAKSLRAPVPADDASPAAPTP